MNYTKLKKHLFDIGDSKLASFSKRISNSDYLFIGIKIPVLRKIIKELYTENEINLNDFSLGEYFEIDFIYFGLSLIKIKDINLQLAFLNNEIGKAKSWMITDSIPSFLLKYNYTTFFSFFTNSYREKEVYKRRLSFVLAIKLYKEKEILNILKYIKENDEYIVDMAKAWLLATIAIKYTNEIYSFLKDMKPSLLKRKTISKINESYRIKKEDKERFKLLRD